MKLLKWLRLMKRKIQLKIDPRSLQVRLTLGIAVVSAVGIGSVAMWTSWKMQQILVDTHKQNIKYVADRFPRAVERYSEMRSAETGLQPAIDNLTAENVMLWVKSSEGAIAAQSMALMGRADTTSEALIELSMKPMPPQVYYVNDRYFVLYSNPLKVKGMKLGALYVAQDITNEQTMLEAVVRSVSLASILAILTITATIAVYVRRSLQPLRTLSHLTDGISADKLGVETLHAASLQKAPSEVRELAQTCEKMLDRLSEAWEQQRQIFSNISHELRTPLTIVSGYLQSTLRRGTNLTEPQREALEIAAGEADRTIGLLQDLLDLARADSGYLHFHLESLVLNDLVAEIAGMAKQYSNRTIEIETGTDRVEVKADRNRLKQVLLNLIDNAVKYSDTDKPIKLKISLDGDSQKDDSYSPLGLYTSRAVVQVCDKGSGISLQNQARIFERFYRCDEDRSRSKGGTGLGLAIVKTLVEGMGGRVTVRSALGEGSVFTVTLPIQP